MKKKKSLSILGIVAAVLLLIVVLITLTLNVLVSQHDTPKIFGNYVYLMESDSMEVKPSTDGSTTIDASASIHAKTAVICKAYDGSEPLSKNNAILCVLAPEDTSSDKDKEGMAIRGRKCKLHLLMERCWKIKSDIFALPLLKKIPWNSSKMH